MAQQADIAAIRRNLRRWYHRERRDLPWRRTRDPYAIWVSEIMLQQTQVAVVAPYFERFMKRFPTVGKLARAKLSSVLKAWEGLGYYGRARRLHEAAKLIVRQRDGRIPETASELRKLPGVGRYTAGAIASIAFDAREPVLDGNVQRVLCRLFRVRGNPSRAATQRTLWNLAESLLPHRGAGEFNQALMELGAMVCTPRAPQCQACSLHRVCAAFTRGEQGRLPFRSRRKPIPHYDIGAGVIRRADGKVLIARRRPEGLLGGLWEFPGGKRREGETLRRCVAREVLEETGVTARVGRPLMTVRHAYSHFRITLHVFECDYVRGEPQAIGCAALKWVAVGQLRRYAFPAANAKIIAALLDR